MDPKIICLFVFSQFMIDCMGDSDLHFCEALQQNGNRIDYGLSVPFDKTTMNHYIFIKNLYWRLSYEPSVTRRRRQATTGPPVAGTDVIEANEEGDDPITDIPGNTGITVTIGPGSQNTSASGGEPAAAAAAGADPGRSTEATGPFKLMENYGKRMESTKLFDNVFTSCFSIKAGNSPVWTHNVVGCVTKDFSEVRYITTPFGGPPDMIGSPASAAGSADITTVPPTGTAAPLVSTPVIMAPALAPVARKKRQQPIPLTVQPGTPSVANTTDPSSSGNGSAGGSDRIGSFRTNFSGYAPQVAYNPYSMMDQNVVVFIQTTGFNSRSNKYNRQIQGFYLVDDVKPWQNLTKANDTPFRRRRQTAITSGNTVLSGKVVADSVWMISRSFPIKAVFGLQVGTVNSSMLLFELCTTNDIPCTGNISYKYCIIADVESLVVGDPCNPLKQKSLIDCSIDWRQTTPPTGEEPTTHDPNAPIGNETTGETGGETGSGDTTPDKSGVSVTPNPKEDSKGGLWWLWVLIVVIIIIIVVAVVLFLCLGKKQEQKGEGADVTTSPKGAAAAGAAAGAGAGAAAAPDTKPGLEKTSSGGKSLSIPSTRSGISDSV